MSVFVLALVACSCVEAHLTHSTSHGSPSKSLRADQPSRDAGYEDAWSRRMLKVWTAHEKSNATETLDDPVPPIDEFRGELCFTRLSLVAHPTCMKWLVEKCKRGSGKYHGSGLCNKLESHVKHHCVRGDEAACDYARQLGMNPDGWDRHHPEGAEAVKASSGEDDVVEDESGKAEGAGTGSGSHHGGGAGQDGEGGSGWPKLPGAGQDGDAGAGSHDGGSAGSHTGRDAGAGSHSGVNNDGGAGAGSHRGGNAGSSGGSAHANSAGADANSAGNAHGGKSASAKSATASGSSNNKAGDGGGSGAHDHDHHKHHHDQEDSAGALSLRMITIAVVTLGLTQV